MVLDHDRAHTEPSGIADPAERGRQLPASVPPDQCEYWNQWHRAHRHASHRFHAFLTRRHFVAGLPRREPTRVLEIGCGQGRDAILLARRGYDVCAIDHSPVALETARGRQPLDTTVTWKQVDYADGLPFPPNSFDGVYSHLSLHYLSEEATVELFENIALVLKPRGMLLFTVRAKRDRLWGLGDKLGNNFYVHEGHVRHFFTTSYTKRLLSGWMDVEVKNYTRRLVANPGVFIRARARRRAD